MENPLLKKLQIKSDFRVCALNAPANFLEIIGPTNQIELSFEPSKPYDALLIFATTRAEMTHALDLEVRKIDKTRICWIIYPKAKSKLAGDLNLMQSWDELKSYQLTPCASAAIDVVWTALRIKPVEAQKKSGLGNAEISSGSYAEFIDVANKVVSLPAEVKAALEQQPQALANFNTLSYSNKKEYLLWILSAKQEKTKQDRIQITVEKLLAGKKNPSEK